MSRQGEFDVFPNFIDAQPNYILHALFIQKFSILPNGSQRSCGWVESGKQIGQSQTAERMSFANSAELHSRSQKRAAPLVEGLPKIMESLAAPAQINLRMRGMDSSRRALEADKRLADTVSCVMGLHGQIRTDIKWALEPHGETYVSVLQ